MAKVRLEALRARRRLIPVSSVVTIVLQNQPRLLAALVRKFGVSHLCPRCLGVEVQDDGRVDDDRIENSDM